MKRFVEKNSKAFLIGISIYQILGGIAGFSIIFSLFNGEEIRQGILAFVPIISLYIFSTWGGIIYFIKGRTVSFFLLSKLNFCAQLLQLAVAGFTYLFYYGPYIAIGFDSDPSLLFRVKLLELNFAIRFVSSDQQSFMFNLFALYILIILRWIERLPFENSEIETFLAEDEYSR